MTEFIRTDTKVPHQVPDGIIKLFDEKYPEFLQGLQAQTIETVDRITSGVTIPDHVKTEIVGALNAFYLSGYWHVMQEQLERQGLHKELKKLRGERP